MLFEIFRIVHFARQDGLFLILVRIEGGDPLFGGAVLLVPQPLLFQGVQFPVPGQQQGSTVRDQQLSGIDGNALGAHVLHLHPQVLHIQRHSVAQDIDHVRAENARGQQVQSESAEIIDDGVAGVPAALITHDDIEPVRQHVHHAAFALIAPVDAHDHTGIHVITPSFPSRRLTPPRSFVRSNTLVTSVPPAGIEDHDQTEHLQKRRHERGHIGQGRGVKHGADPGHLIL